MPNNRLTSRFFVESDEKIDKLIHILPNTWWSRKYEYAWAMRFASPVAVVLDAACGVMHPLKFALAERCLETHACDIDPRITSKSAIIEEISQNLGAAAAQWHVEHWQSNLELAYADLTKLPYMDDKFDVAFCISVLEHMQAREQELALEQFYRVLKPGGLLIFTFDFPGVELDALPDIVSDAGFEFAGDVDLDMPPDALHTEMWGGLHCFRAALRKPL